jgi:hypothetical protein
MGYNGGVHKRLWIYAGVLDYNIFCNFNSKINKQKKGTNEKYRKILVV